jgi:antirestriction protein
MEQHPQPPQGGDEQPAANSYGTDDPETQAHIENARVDASRERTRNREQLGRMAAAGIDPDDAETLIELDRSSIEVREYYSPAPAEAEAEQTASPEHDRREPPRFYVSDLAAHEAGLVHGRWLDATTPLPEIQEEIFAMLMASPVPNADRYAIDDARGFAGFEVTEHTPLAVVSRVGKGIERYGTAYAAWTKVIDARDLDLLDRFSDHHVGSYNSLADWAREFGAVSEWDKHLDESIDPVLRPYLDIDYARFAQDQREHWDVVEGTDGLVHVFLR